MNTFRSALSADVNAESIFCCSCKASADFPGDATAHLCFRLPVCFEKYVTLCNHLTSKETPNYAAIRNMFQ